MSEQQSFFPLDAATTAIVKRYEDFRKGKAAGYFEVDELSDIIDYYLFKNMTKDCEGVLELGNKLHPNSKELKVKRARTCFEKGDVRNALKILDNLNNDSDYETQILRIELLEKMGRCKEAQMLANKLYEDEIADDPDDNDVICIDLANVFIAQKNYDMAMKWLIKGEQVSPQNIDIQMGIAMIYEQRQEYQKAEDIYHQILDTDVFSAEVWFNLGHNYYSQGDYHKALDAFNYAAALDDKDTLTMLLRAHVLYQLCRFEDAIELYKTYGESTGDIWQSNILVAESYEQMQKYDLAIEYFKKSLEEYPKNYNALIGIGSCLLSQEKYEESAVFIKRALQVQDNEPDGWSYLAEAFVGMGNTLYALLAYVKSLTLNTEQPEVLFASANILFGEGYMQDALDIYLDLRKDNHQFELIEVYIAACYFSLGDTENGIAYLNESMKIDYRTKDFFLKIAPQFYKFLPAD